MKFRSKYEFSDYVGKRIFYLTPINEVDELAKDGSKQWAFRCICGKTVITTPYRVISGHIKSCGCMRYKNIKKQPVQSKGVPYFDPADFVGLKNNHLTVIDVIPPMNGERAKLKCICDCGHTTYCLPYQFKNGAVKSCGCIRHRGNLKDGSSKNPLYQDWRQMISRCYKKTASNYSRYGGRGITVCEEWRKSPFSFYEWVESVGGKPAGTTLDRIDNNGPYSPENCRFADIRTQSRNKRSNIILTYNGKTQCLTDWANEYGINDETLRGRLKKGMSLEEALKTPIKK